MSSSSPPPVSSSPPLGSPPSTSSTTSTSMSAPMSPLEVKQRQQTPSQKPGVFGKVRMVLVGGLETAFCKYGEFAAKWWWVVILVSVFAFFLMASGYTMLEKENDQLNMWVPTNHPYRENNDWLQMNKPASKIRYNAITVFADLDGDKNVLTVSVIKKLFALRKKLGEINTGVAGHTSTWDKICSRQRVSRGGGVLGRGGGGAAGGGLSSVFPAICPMMNKMLEDKNGPNTACGEGHILELWAVNGTLDSESQVLVNALSDKDILDAINDPAAKSAITGRPYNIQGQLGDHEKDSSGKIVSAKAMSLYFLGDASDEGAKEAAKDWEKDYITTVQEMSEKELEPLGFKAIPFAARSLGDTYGEDIGSDLNLLIFGYILVFAFVLFMVGSFNLVEARPFLSILGLICIGLGLYSSYGIGGFVGLKDTNMNSLMPFLLLGIGVDDMFVIVQSFENLRGEELENSLVKRFGLTMKHAGVAITVTSVTDLLAFGIGGSTAIPSMSSFCIFAALGIFGVFFYMITFFFGWFYLDQRRMESERNFLICCYTHKDHEPNKCSKMSIQRMVFEKYAELLTMWPVKAVVILITLAALSVGIYGATQLETDFNYIDYVNEGTYVRDYLEVMQSHYSSASGASGTVYIGGEGLDFSANMAKVKSIIQTLKDETSSDGTLMDDGKLDTSFPLMFEKWVNSVKQQDLSPSEQYPQTALDASTFDKYLAEYLFAGGGLAYASSLVFDGELKCAEKAPKIKLMSLPYSHKKTLKAKDMVDLMNRLTGLMDKESEKFPSGAKVFAHSSEYVNYITMEIITQELARNIGLALLCVFLATMFLLAHLLISLMVVTNVLLTLVNVAGYMWMWGLSIDTAASILLTIALGLAVDYSAHIAHAFMAAPGDNRNDKMRRGVSDMGPAVFNGGFSTFLAFALLMTSKSFVFVTFFKIFFLVVGFGLYHGLVFLPVILSICGPASTTSEDDHGGQGKNIVAPAENATPPSKKSANSWIDKEVHK